MIVPTLQQLKDRDGGGHELLAYRRGRDGWVDVKAADINEYLKQVTGGDYSAKDFRTWNATVLAAVELATNGHEATTKSARKRAATAATKRVADVPLQHARRLPQGLHRSRGSSTATTAARRSASRCGGWSPARDPGEFVDRERIERAVLRLIAD